MPDVTGRDVDKGWAWVVLPAAALNLAIQDAYMVSVGIFQVELLETFSGSQGLVALICAFAVGGQVIFGPVAGVMADQLTPRVTIMLGGALMSAALLSSSFCQSLSSLLLLFGIVAGLGTGLCYTPSIAVTSFYFRKYRSIANGFTLAAPGLGLLAGPYLLRWLISSYGWRYAMVIFGGLVAQICVLAALFYPHNPACLKTPGCCHSRARPPASGDPALKASSKYSKDTDSLVLSKGDHGEDQEEVVIDCKPEAGPQAELQILLESRTDLEVREGSRTDLEVKAGSRTNLEVRTGSRSDVHSRPVSSVFGSVMLNHSMESIRDQSVEPAPVSFFQRIKRLLCHKVLWVICVNQVLMMCGHAINLVLFPAFAQSKGAAFTDIPALYTAYGVTIVIARITGGFVFSAIPQYLVHAFFGLQVALAVVFALYPVYGTSLPALFVGIVMVGLTYGPTYLLLSLIIIRYVGLSDLPMAFGLGMLTCGAAFLVAPTIAGITYDMFNTYSASYYIAGSTVGAGTLPLLFLLCFQNLEVPEVKDDRNAEQRSTNPQNHDGLVRDTEDHIANEKSDGELAPEESANQRMMH